MQTSRHAVLTPFRIEINMNLVTRHIEQDLCQSPGQGAVADKTLLCMDLSLRDLHADGPAGGQYFPGGEWSVSFFPDVSGLNGVARTRFQQL
jgi:hypothetical protein